ncbi:CHAT domain-containing protein [Streptomyces sp. BE20]|uniref:CHAT domain-containing protein n=1 Tax=Streptomyces sp. BE20 TaxID=3002525 RepID=UPI002E763736|nr:CHAT domain-containing protein [Streptomyces sp. BE20]MEE1822075.1 CHAT domain-containing protein [Streptomyces sp. BE20]
MTSTGGLAGVRSWALDATGRAEALLLPDPSGPPRLRLDDPVAHDRLIDELDRLEGLLAPDEPAGPVLAARLGGLLAQRHLRGGGAPADRPHALRLLREARAHQVPLTGWEAHRAALYLVMLVIPHPAGRPDGGTGHFSALIGWQLDNPGAFDPRGPEVTELRGLLDDLRGVRLMPELRAQLDTMTTVLGLAQGDTADFAAGVGPLVESLPADFPGLQQLRMLMSLIPTVPAPTAPTPAGPLAEPTPSAPAPVAPPPAEPSRPRVPIDTEAEREEFDRTMAMTLAMVEMSMPGSLAPEQLTELAQQLRPGRAHGTGDPADAAQDALAYAMTVLVPALQQRDQGLLSDALGSLQRAADGLPPGSDWHQLLGAIGPAVLSASQYLGGNLVDAEAAERQLTEVLGRLGDLPLSFTAQVRALAAGQRSHRFQRAEDRAGVASCIEELRAVREGLSGEDSALGITLLMLGSSYQDLWTLTRDTETLRTGAQLMEEGARLLDTGPGNGGLLEPLRVNLSAIRAVVDGDPGLIRAHPGPESSEHPPSLLNGRGRRLPLDAFVSHLQAELTRSRADQDRAVEELAAACRDAADGGTWQHADLLWALAEAHRRRGDAGAGDRASAAQAMVESFEVLTADVLLEVGAEHRLMKARDGASRALDAAWWAGSQGQVERAVTMLELGRSMVLQAAAASAEVPELLAARGHRELADAWRQAESAQGGGAAQPVPSLLRRRALDALRGGPGLFEPPTPAELSAGLRPGETDALVYLLPGAEGTPGMAVILGPDLEPGVLALPQLALAGRAPLESFLDVSAERSRLRRAAARAAETGATGATGEADAAARALDAPWEKALADLCDWAWPAVVGPVLLGIAERLEANPGRHRGRPGPPRFVLIPCGNLGAVPWHAARLPEDARHRYACEIMVLSYAASGREFLRAAARERIAPGARPVLVADPRMDLTRAELEVLALRDGYYPDAELYGEYYQLDGDPAGLGTPEDVLALLPGAGAPRPLSLLHIASHGSAGVRPTVSALNLAPPDPAQSRSLSTPPSDPSDPSTNGPTDAPDAGMLTVTRLLDRPAATGAVRAGPLVVLSACETDLSTRDHDEALTLATAFLAAGAKDVVGSRWTTRDGASALMMAVFHHHVAVTGLSPADALRAAQLWMLDPRREPPESLGGELRREAAHPHLDRLPLWAAFIHQGHPGAADPPPNATDAPDPTGTARTTGTTGTTGTTTEPEGTE